MKMKVQNSIKLNKKISKNSESVKIFEKYRGIIVILLLILFFIQAVTSMIKNSPTVDEPSHIFAGYAYITQWNLKINIEHPIFIKLLSAIPLKFLNPKVSSENETLDENYNPLYTQGLAQRFFYENRENNLNYKMLFLSRLMIVLLGLLLGFYVYKFASLLFGVKAGLLALFLYSFCPNILAHSRLVTTDLGLACFGFIFIYYLYRYKKESKNLFLILSAFFLGLTLVSKYSAVLFFPSLLLLFLPNKKGENKKFYLKTFISIICICLIALFIIHLTYGFEKPNFSYIVPLPQSYSEGLQMVAGHSQAGHPTFLAGMHSLYAWHYYILIAFLLKTPITTIIFFLASIIFFLAGLIKKRNMEKELFLILPILVFFIFFSFFTKKVLGLRYILPVYPFIFILGGNLINLKSRIFKIIILVLSIFYIISSIAIYPHYLAYFNEAVAGKGDKYLIDSNLDWAQNHFLVEKYLQNPENNVSDLKMNLFYYFQFSNYNLPPHENIPCRPVNGTLIISTTMLQGLFEYNLPHEQNCYSWLRKYKPIDKIGKSIFVYKIE